MASIRVATSVPVAIVLWLMISQPALSFYSCDIPPGDKCHCKGSDDCVDLRHSGMCSGPLVCKKDGSCACDAKMVQQKTGPGKTGTVNPQPPSDSKTIGVKPPPATGSQPSGR
jgi:hypothetical protein